MTSTNKRKLSKGQRVSRTRKETGRQAGGSGGRAEWLIMGAKLELLGLPAKGVKRWGEEGARKGVEGNCPRLCE